MADGDSYGPAFIGLAGAVLVALLTSVVTSFWTLSTIQSEHSDSVHATTYADRRHVYMRMINDLSSLQLPGGLAENAPLVSNASTRLPEVLVKVLSRGPESFRLDRPRYSLGEYGAWALRTTAIIEGGNALLLVGAPEEVENDWSAVEDSITGLVKALPLPGKDATHAQLQALSEAGKRYERRVSYFLGAASVDLNT